MKIERLIGIVFYLINRENVTANQLAEQFQVSRRTILRDIDTLTLAGIPIYSEVGVTGGYKINKDFRANEKIMDSINAKHLLLAMESLKSVYGNKKVEETYEKVKHIYAKNSLENSTQINFSVISENSYVVNLIEELKSAVEKSKLIEFTYTNSCGNTRSVKLKPLQVYYKWYSWYIFGQDIVNENYRIFKVVRMTDLIIKKEAFVNKFDVEKLLKEYEQGRAKDNIAVTLSYSKEINTLINEYFSGNIIEENGDSIIRVVEIKEKDFMSFSLLLGFGDKVKVISPESYKAKLINHSQEIFNNYSGNSDR